MSRNNENELAEDLVNSDVDFFAGGGIRHFIPKSMTFEDKDPVGAVIKSKRTDEKNLIDEFEKKGYQTFIGAEGAANFNKTDFSSSDKVFAA